MAVQLNNNENLVDKIKEQQTGTKSAVSATKIPASKSEAPARTQAKPAAAISKPSTTSAKPVSSKPSSNAKYTGYTGIYVNRNGAQRAAVVTILKPDNTCGMFLMVPSPQMIMWMGYTTYQMNGNEILFTVKSVSDGKGGIREAKSGDQEFVRAHLEAGDKYTQGDGEFNFISSDLSYWQKEENSWNKIGEARKLEGQADFDTAHEIRKVILSTINKFGNDFGW